MNFQEMFDTAFAGLESQGFKKSQDLNKGGCCYRGDGDMKCAAGWLLPDDKHTVEHNQFFIWSHPWFMDTFDNEQLKFIEALQRAHDQSAGVKSMRNRLIDVAERYELTHPGRA